MKVDIPVGELRGMKIDKFEVVYPEKWTKEHKNRKDVMSPLQLSRMLVEGSARSLGGTPDSLRPGESGCQTRNRSAEITLILCPR